MRLTLFSSLTDPTAPTHEIAWPDLVERLKAPAVYADKYLCPLIKLAVFGNTRSPKGMLRNDANVVAVSGIELDYDGQTLALADGAERLARAGVRSVLYTSASHKPNAPRWRVLIPLKGEYPPAYRRSLYDAANAILGGVCDPVSATLSQAYFIGAVDGVEYECRVLDGKHLDEVVEPVAKPLDLAASDIRVPEWRPVDLNALPIDDDTRRLIREGVPKPGRSEALLSAANALARARVHPDDIVRVLADPANGISAKALENRRQQSAMEWLLRHTIRKALEAYPSPETAFAEPVDLGGRVIERKPLFIAGRDLTAAPRPINWLIRHTLERPILAVLFGGPGVGKSYMAIEWACRVATGTDWLDHKVTRGPVVYIAGEGYGGMPRRLKAWEIETGVSVADAPIFVTRRGVAFNDPQAFAELMAELDALPEPPVFIVVDTLARATPGMDEDRANEMTVFVNLCDRLREKYGATVLVIHHSPHGDPRRAKGSIALKGAIDAEFGMIRTDRDGPVTLFCPKMKEGEPPADMHFAFKRVVLPWPDDADGIAQASAVMVRCEAPEPKAGKPRRFKLTVNDHQFLSALGVEPIAKEKVCEAFMQLHGGTEEARKRAWYRTMQRGSRRQWFQDDGHTLVPSVFAIRRDQRGEGDDTDSDKSDNE